MIIVCWNYGPMESMDGEILPFVKSGFQFIVLTPVNCWNRIYPDMDRATINIYNFLRDGYKQHALGFINTTWDDNGQNLFNNNYIALFGAPIVVGTRLWMNRCNKVTQPEKTGLLVLTDAITKYTLKRIGTLLLYFLPFRI